MPETRDAVVIGAGHNGLVAANLLADAGWDVVVIEATDHPGGAVRSVDDLPARGYTADLFSAFYPLAAASPVLRALDLPEHGLTWCHAPAVLAHVFDDDRAAILSRHLEQTSASVEAFGSGDGAAWRRWAARFEEVEDVALSAIFRPFPPVRDGVRLATRLGPARSLRLARLATVPVRRFTQEEFAGDGARMLVAGNALHSDLPPEAVGSTVYGLMLSMLGQRHGFPVPAGGAGGLVDALVARLRSRGGTLRCGDPVRQVLLDGGHATGVQLAGGETIRATRAVLADVPAPTLYLDLVGEDRLPARMRHDLARFEWDNATVKVDWALSGPIPWRAAEVGGAGTVHLGADLDGLTRYSADLATGRVPERPFVVLGQMTTADPSRSPAGTEAAWAYTHLPPGDHAVKQVAAVVDAIETTVERRAPGFRDLVVARHVQGPADLQRANPALVGGAINGGTAAVHQQLVFRPTPGLGRPDTPFPGLFLAGASAHPGGGVHGACGGNAARAALSRAQVGAVVYDRTVGALERLLS